MDDFEGIPVQTNFLWFKASGRKSKLKEAKNIKLDIENGNCIPKEEDIRETLHSCNDVCFKSVYLRKEIITNILDI